MCLPHDCLALPFKSIVIQEVIGVGDFIRVLSALRRVCGNVTEFISLLWAKGGITASLRPAAQSLAANGAGLRRAVSAKGDIENLT